MAISMLAVLHVVCVSASVCVCMVLYLYAASTKAFHLVCGLLGTELAHPDSIYNNNNKEHKWGDNG